MNIRVRLLCFAACALLLMLAAGQNESLRQLRRSGTQQAVLLTPQEEPLLAFTTIVLGGFRGIVADLLWLRATRLQDEGRHVELVQLSDWITKFEPRATQAWAFHAWNMAYNVSTMMSDPAERWRWVRNGLSLLRDRGLRYNPGDPGLFFELALLYYHKIGRTADEFHEFYKQQLAAEVHAILQGPRPDYSMITPAREQALLDAFKLEPSIMQEIERQTGPLDWRLPESHAIYWAMQGVAAKKDGQDIRTAMLINHSLATTFFSGTLVSPDADSASRQPNVAVFDALMKTFAQIRRDFGDEIMGDSYRLFLSSAVKVLGDAGLADQQERARKALATLAAAPGGPAGP